MALHPERALRLLDQLDCLGGMLRLAWAGHWGTWLRAASLASCLVLGAVAWRLVPF